jgi:hypothetical protein
MRGESGAAFTALVFAENQVEFPGLDSLVSKPAAFQALVHGRFAKAFDLEYSDPVVGLTRIGLLIRPGAVYWRSAK